MKHFIYIFLHCALISTGILFADDSPPDILCGLAVVESTLAAGGILDRPTLQDEEIPIYSSHFLVHYTLSGQAATTQKVTDDSIRLVYRQSPSSLSPR